jgi:hypothetical protein
MTSLITCVYTVALKIGREIEVRVKALSALASRLTSSFTRDLIPCPCPGSERNDEKQHMEIAIVDGRYSVPVIS